MSDESASQLTVQVERIGPAAVVRLRGSAGMSEAGELKGRLEQLADRALSPIVVDLTEVSFISSAGLGALISARLKGRRHGGQIHLVNPQPAVLRVLETTQLTRVFDVFPTVDQALS